MASFYMLDEGPYSEPVSCFMCLEPYRCLHYNVLVSIHSFNPHSLMYISRIFIYPFDSFIISYAFIPIHSSPLSTIHFPYIHTHSFILIHSFFPNLPTIHPFPIYTHTFIHWVMVVVEWRLGTTKKYCQNVLHFNAVSPQRSPGQISGLQARLRSRPYLLFHPI